VARATNEKTNISLFRDAEREQNEMQEWREKLSNV
jgi:hypothetical protein